MLGGRASLRGLVQLAMQGKAFESVRAKFK